MYTRIVQWLRPELLEQFKDAALAVKAPRKWAVFEAVAKQVAERGELPKTLTAAAGKREDPLLARMFESAKRRAEWEKTR
jgi:hypothetical protein